MKTASRSSVRRQAKNVVSNDRSLKRRRWHAPRGKEKLIREILLDDDVIEAIIGLPPNLFYGTGIPACVIVVNKNKPDELRDKIFFINADAEYAE